MPQDQQPASAGSTTETSGRRWPLARDLVQTSFKAIVAVAGAVAVVTTALYIVAPQFKPREKLGAELDRISIAQHVDYLAYEAMLDTIHNPDHEAPEQPGLVVWVHANLIGYEDRAYSVGVTAYDANTLTQIEGPRSAPFYSSCENKSPKAKEDGVAWRCWLAAPPAGTKFIVRAELFDQGRAADLVEGPTHGQVLLDFLDSATTAAHARQ